MTLQEVQQVCLKSRTTELHNLGTYLLLFLTKLTWKPVPIPLVNFLLLPVPQTTQCPQDQERTCKGQIRNERVTNSYFYIQ